MVAKEGAQLSETRPVSKVSGNVDWFPGANRNTLRIHFFLLIERGRFDCNVTPSRNGLFEGRDNTKIEEVAFDIHDEQMQGWWFLSL